MRARAVVRGISMLTGLYMVVLRVLSVVVPDAMEVERMVGILNGKEEG